MGLEDSPPLTLTLVPDFLTKAECESLIARLQSAGIGATSALYPPSYRNNDRLVLDDEALAAAFYARMAEKSDAAGQPILAETLFKDGELWRRQRLNPRFRCCRYRDGQCFTIHRDGVYHASSDERSQLTFMIYLNDGDEFTGGATRYYTDRSGRELLRSVRPRRGACIVFDHALWHDGEAVFSGAKYVLRSDVIYSRKESKRAVSFSTAHNGYIFCVIALSDGTIASGGRDQTIRIWDSSSFLQRQLIEGRKSSIGCLAEACGLLWGGDRQGRILRFCKNGSDFMPESEFFAHQGATLCLLPLENFAGVASGGADGKIHIFGEAPEPLVTVFGNRSWVWALAGKGDRLWSAGEDGTVRRFSLATRACEAVATLNAPVHALALSEDGASLFAGTADGRIVTLAAESLQVARDFAAHDGAVQALLYLGDGQLASGSEDGTVAIRDAASMTVQRGYAHADFVRALGRLPCGALVSGSYDGSLRRFA